MVFIFYVYPFSIILQILNAIPIAIGTQRFNYKNAVLHAFLSDAKAFHLAKFTEKIQ